MTIRITTQRKVKKKHLISLESNTLPTADSPWIIRNISHSLPSRMSTRMAILFTLMEVVKCALISPYWFDLCKFAPKLPRYWNIDVFIIDANDMAVFRIEAHGEDVWHGTVDIVYNRGARWPVVIVEGHYFNMWCAIDVLTLVLQAIAHYIATPDP